jgi:hypothetical protein
MSPALLVELRALRKAGLSYGKIAQQLGLERGTVAKRCQTDALIAEIGPKVKLNKGYFTGPVKRKIELFLRYNPLATLADTMCQGYLQRDLTIFVETFQNV